MEEEVIGRLRLIALFALLAALCMAVVARPALADGDDDELARRLYLEGEDAYAAGRYRDAAKKFEKAFALSKRPALLFNLGNTYERMGDFDKAASALQRYLDLPNPQRVAETEQRIRGLRKKAEADRKRKAELRKLRDKEGKSKRGGDKGPSRLPPYLLIGGGGAVVVAGVLFGLGASSAGSDAAGKCETGPSGGLFCPIDAESSLDRERNLSIVADISFVVGTGAVVAGIIWLLMEDKPVAKTFVDPDGYVDDDEGNDGEGYVDDDETSLMLGPTLLPGGGGGLGLTGRF